MINFAHLHLLLVHFPIILFPLSALLLIVGLVRKEKLYISLAVCIIIVSAALAGASYLSGGEAEELVEDLPGIAESTIEHHEDAALYGLILSIVSALLSLAAWRLMVLRHPLSAPLLKVLTLLAVITSIVYARVGFLGGQIRHPEAYKTTDTAESAAMVDEH